MFYVQCYAIDYNWLKFNLSIFSFDRFLSQSIVKFSFKINAAAASQFFKYQTRVLKTAVDPVYDPKMDVDTEFLPLIYDIVRSIEKEMSDGNLNSKSTKDVNDTNQKILLLKEKFQNFRDAVMKIEGIEYGKEEQLNKLNALSKQLIMKKELLFRYKHGCPIDSSVKIL